MPDVVALLLGLALTWALGVALVEALARTSSTVTALPLPWRLGVGWFVGVLLTTLVMRGVSRAGIPFSILSIGAPMLVATLACAAIALRGRAGAPVPGLRGLGSAMLGADLDGWQRLAWRLVVAWLALRFALLLAEVWWRPLYPWDAWTQWGTKARAWFEMRTMVPFVGIGEWLSATGTPVWFDAAPHYPGTMPLVQTWGALLLGRWDDALVNLPWWLTGVALLLALVGAFTLLGFGRLPALAGAALVLTLPIVNVHIALAGYADLPMACYVTLGAIAVLHAIRTRAVRDMAIALLLLVALVLVKNPGKAWVVTLVPAFIVAALPRHGLRLAIAMLGLAAFALLVAVRSGITVLGYKFAPQFVMPWGALFDAYFSFANWNLLWYAAVATVVVGWRHLFAPGVAPFTLAVLSGLLFLFVGFAFTHAAAWVEDQSTVNRATLHLAPLVVVWMFVCLRAWLAGLRAPAAPVSAAA
jgi:hypothetical protein